MKDFSGRTGRLPGLALALLVLSGMPGNRLAGQQPPAAGPKHYSAAAVSPNGAWLLITLRRMDREKMVTAGRPIETWRSSSFRIFKFTSLAKKPRSFTLVMPAAAGYTPYLEAPIILDDGTVIGLKNQSHVAIWDKAGKYQEKEIFQGSGFSSSFAVLPGAKEVLVSREPFGNKDPINEILDLKTFKLDKPACLQGLAGRSVVWTADEKHLFAAESAPGKKMTVTSDDGEEYSFTTRAWRLVRVAAATNERAPLAKDITVQHLVAGKDSLVGVGKVDQDAGFFRVKRSSRGACRLVPSLAGWLPALSLGEEKFLVRSDKAYGIVDFGPGDDKDPAVTPITLPEHREILYTAAGKGLILGIDERNWRMINLEGKVVWPLLLPE